MCINPILEANQQSSPDAQEQEVKALRAQLSASQNQIQSECTCLNGFYTISLSLHRHLEHQIIYPGIHNVC